MDPTVLILKLLFKLLWAGAETNGPEIARATTKVPNLTMALRAGGLWLLAILIVGGVRSWPWSLALAVYWVAGYSFSFFWARWCPWRLARSLGWWFSWPRALPLAAGANSAALCALLAENPRPTLPFELETVPLERPQQAVDLLNLALIEDLAGQPERARILMECALQCPWGARDWLSQRLARRWLIKASARNQASQVIVVRSAFSLEGAFPRDFRNQVRAAAEEMAYRSTTALLLPIEEEILAWIAFRQLFDKVKAANEGEHYLATCAVLEPLVLWADALWEEGWEHPFAYSVYSWLDLQAAHFELAPWTERLHTKMARRPGRKPRLRWGHLLEATVRPLSH